LLNTFYEKFVLSISRYNLHLASAISNVAHRIPLGDQISHFGFAQDIARGVEMNMRTGGTIFGVAYFRLTIRFSATISAVQLCYPPDR
jgi:hypothetical protein